MAPDIQNTVCNRRRRCDVPAGLVLPQEIAALKTQSIDRTVTTPDE